MPVETLIVIAAAVVFLFDFTNGFHDASNMIATMIASRALTPIQAVALVSLFGFLGPLLGGTAVADTIGGFVDVDGLGRTLSLRVVLAGLGGAIAWNLVTWWRGLPSSSSHALVGSLVGAVLVSLGPPRIRWGIEALARGELAGVAKILASLLLSPALGLALGLLVHKLARRLLARARPGVNRILRKAQLPTAALLAFAHGTNDGQKSMGVLTLLLLVAGRLEHFEVPAWVVGLCATAMALGTAAGGWRIVKTVGYGIYRVRPLHALDSQLASGGVVLAAGLIGGPVSTTHVVTASIMGVGAAERPRAVRWGKAREIAATWVVTLPGAALLGALAERGAALAFWLSAG